MRPLCLAAMLLAAAGPSQAQDLSSTIDPVDADVLAAETLKPDAVKAAPGEPGKLQIRVLIEQGSRWLPVPYLAFHATLGGKPALAAADPDGVAVVEGCKDGEPVAARADLTEASFAIRPLLARYVAAQAACGQILELDFRKDDRQAAALRAWRVGSKAQVALAGAVGPSAWPNDVVFHLGGGGETGAKGADTIVDWDATTFVIGHELGHAISNVHGMIQMGFDDGSHQMTGCVAESAALEEGWASFFGAWADQGVGTEEPTAEWDQRRSIPIKTLPTDVPIGMDGSQHAGFCAGPGNEMRVLSFLWNVTASDGLGVPMKELWKLLDGKHLATVAQVARGLELQGVDRAKLAAVWQGAFDQPYTPSL